jgi:ketosteroid isomerase-like protein
MSSGAHDVEFRQQLELAEQEMRDRMERYAAAWNAADLDTLLSFFVDEGLDFSDYGTPT